MHEDDAAAPVGHDGPGEEAAGHETTAAMEPSTGRSGQLRWSVIDALLPGAGHLVAGRRRLALAFGLPTLIAILALVLLVATTSLARLAAEAVNALTLILAIEGVVLAWRLLAVIAGVAAVGRRSPGTRHGLAVALLVALVVVPQAYLGYLTNVAREEVDRVFVDDTGGAWHPSPTPGPTLAPSATPTIAPSPSPTPAVARVNVLLIGVDAGVGRNTANTDTMIVASLDPATETVSMVSLPRDMVDVPLPDGSIFAPKLNGLDSYARHHPSAFPGSDGTGHDVLMAAVGTLLGLQIDYYAAVNLGGFVQVVDKLGGVDVNVARSMCDPTYTEYGFEHGFSIKAGFRHLNGLQALAYARIRKASGESDFTRAARQQEVISGLRDAIVKRGFLSDPASLLQTLGRSMSTNVPRELLPDLADIMVKVDRNHTYRTVIDHPLVKPGYDARGSIQIPDIVGIRALAAKLFPTDGTLPLIDYAAPPPVSEGGTPSGSGTGSCAPAPTPTPKPTPSPEPSGSPSAEQSPATTPTPAATPSPTAP